MEYFNIRLEGMDIWKNIWKEWNNDRIHRPSKKRGEPCRNVFRNSEPNRLRARPIVFRGAIYSVLILFLATFYEHTNIHMGDSVKIDLFYAFLRPNGKGRIF